GFIVLCRGKWQQVVSEGRTQGQRYPVPIRQTDTAVAAHHCLANARYVAGDHFRTVPDVRQTDFIALVQDALYTDLEVIITFTPTSCGGVAGDPVVEAYGGGNIPRSEERRVGNG